MANSREAQLQWEITKDMTDRGWMAGTAVGYVLKDEYVSELERPHYRLTKRVEECLRLEVAGEDFGLTSVSDVRSAKPHDPEKQRLAEIIDRHNDLNGAEVSDNDKLHFANGIVDRIERDEAVMAQVRSHSEEQVMHSLFPKRVTDAVVDAMNDHKKLSMPLLEDEKTVKQGGLNYPASNIYALMLCCRIG